MTTMTQLKVFAGVLALVVLLSTNRAAGAKDERNPYPDMAPTQQYRMSSRSEEIALARSAAPASLSNDAEILVLADHGYETAVKGKNGFVCLVERAWFASFDDPQFWNPNTRGPDCLNPAAASSVLPANLERTQWVLAGLSKTEMVARTKTSAVARIVPARGALGYMLSKQQRLGDNGHWHPHLMFFEPHTISAAWGADLPGSPVSAFEGAPNEGSVFFVVLSTWSDGTAVLPAAH
jgi:hypothetical protein